MSVRAFWIASSATLAVLMLAALALGAVAIPPRDLWEALSGAPGVHATIVRDIRAPRALLSALVGAALGAAGAGVQGALRNELAEPYLLGVSGGAAVGAVLAATIGMVASMIAPAAFVGALAATGAVLAVARGGRSQDARTLLLAGVVVGAFANAAIMILLVAAPAGATRGALWWMMGSAADADWRGALVLAAWIALPIAWLTWRGRDLDALALGGDAAASLGVDPERTARRVFVASAVLAAASVAAAGLVGFVGLVVPNLVRAAGVRGHRALIPGAALGGAVLVAGADLLARTVRPPHELPLGAITALLGVPFFVARLRRAGP